MKKLTMSLIAAAMVAGGTTTALAEEGVSYNLGVTSNYMWRGMSQTSDGAAVQGGADYTSGDMSLGIWGSNVAAGAEIDLYGSYAIDKLSFGAIYYYYTDSVNTAFYEINGSYDFGVAAATASYNPSAASGWNTLYLEVGGSTEVSEGINIDWHVGNASGVTSVSDYSLGVSGAFSGIDVSAAYANTTATGAQGKVFVSAGKSF